MWLFPVASWGLLKSPARSRECGHPGAPLPIGRRGIAHELTEIVRNDAKTDWQVKETVRAKLRTRIKRLLLKDGYTPDQAPSATELIIKQAAMIAENQSNA